MFRSSLNRVLDWAERALAPSDEAEGVVEVGALGAAAPVGALGAAAPVGAPGAAAPVGALGAAAPVGAPSAAAPVGAPSAPPPHPHRRELRWERKRRPGSLPRPPAHCISPVVRRGGVSRPRDGSAR